MNSHLIKYIESFAFVKNKKEKIKAHSVTVAKLKYVLFVSVREFYERVLKIICLEVGNFIKRFSGMCAKY